MRDFAFLQADLIGLALAAPLAIVLWFLPAALISRALSIAAPKLSSTPLTPALAFAVLPTLDALVIRVAGVPVAAFCHIAAAAAGVAFARPWIPSVRRMTLFAAAGWWIYLAVVYVDFDHNGRLHQSLLVLDLVKHAAVVREITAHGLPLHDPFFLRSEAAGYYHYFYDGGAVLDWLGGGLVDARMAFAALAFACGVAFAALFRAFVVELGWQRSSERRLTAGVILLCAIGGLDLIGIWLRWEFTGLLERNSEWWDDEISLFTTSASWVPHHLAAVIACFTAILLLARAQEDESRKSRIALFAAAGVSMASAFGLSVWVTLGSVGILAVSVPLMAGRNLVRWISGLSSAGLVAALLSVPLMTELLSGRGYSGAPLGVWVRDPARVSQLMHHPLSPWIRLAATPLIWLVEFGALAVGSYVFWRSRSFDTASTLWRLLCCSLVGGLAMNLFVQSTIINNDFGWRVAWFASFPAMLMTLAVLQWPSGELLKQPILLASIAFGLAATLYNMVSARLPAGGVPHSEAYINADPSTDYALAQAYRWASRGLPADAVLQHNPASQPRAIDFGLYGRQRTYVADGQAALFGAGRDQVRERAHRIGDVFAGALPITAAQGLYLIVTPYDGLWRRVTSSQCIYRSRTVCITRKIAS